MQSNQQLFRHNFLKHADPTSPSSEVSEPSPKKMKPLPKKKHPRSVTEVNVLKPPEGKFGLTQIPVEFPSSRIENSKYFSAQHNGLGAAYLAGLASFKLSNVSERLDPRDVSLFFSVARL